MAWSISVESWIMAGTAFASIRVGPKTALKRSVWACSLARRRASRSWASSGARTRSRPCRSRTPSGFSTQARTSSIKRSTEKGAHRWGRGGSWSAGKPVLFGAKKSGWSSTNPITSWNATRQHLRQLRRSGAANLRVARSEPRDLLDSPGSFRPPGSAWRAWAPARTGSGGNGSRSSGRAGGGRRP